MTTAHPAAEVASTAAVPSTASPAERKRVSGQSPSESGSGSQDDHRLT
jgi:hypothetical protein